jgi:hypothetical protein
VTRYRIPCRYQGAQSSKEDAALFVCGVVAATLGADVDFNARGEGRDFDVLILESAIQPDPARLNYWRQVTAANLERIAGCSVEIGKPESIEERVEPEATA